MAKSWKAKAARNQGDEERLKRLIQLREQTRGPRMASGEATQLILREMLPWDKRTRGETYGQDFWVGLNSNEYMAKADELAKQIVQSGSNRTDRRLMKQTLMDRYGYGPDQATQEIADIFNLASNPDQQLAAVRLGVPNAAADEGLAKALMQSSGIDNVRAWNRGDPIWATDLMADIGSGPSKGVDAQRRFNNDLNLDIFMNMRPSDAKAARLEIVRNPDQKLGKMIEEINSPTTHEGKFMQSREFNNNPSKKISNEDTFQNIRKDYLISSDMSDYVQSGPDALFFRRNQGPYNPRPGQDYQMIDLNMMREELLDTPIGELIGANSRGFDIVNMGRSKQSLKLKVPKREVMYFSNNDLLDREIINEITRRRNK
jgi:hypothetical protein